MKYSIERINPGSVAKVVSTAAALLLAMFILVVLVLAIARTASNGTAAFGALSGYGIALAVMPFIYMITVYLVAYLLGLAYNLASRLVGGIRIELSRQ